MIENYLRPSFEIVKSAKIDIPLIEDRTIIAVLDVSRHNRYQIIIKNQSDIEIDYMIEGCYVYPTTNEEAGWVVLVEQTTIGEYQTKLIEENCFLDKIKVTIIKRTESNGTIDAYFKLVPYPAID